MFLVTGVADLYYVPSQTNLSEQSGDEAEQLIKSEVNMSGEISQYIKFFGYKPSDFRMR